MLTITPLHTTRPHTGRQAALFDVSSFAVLQTHCEKVEPVKKGEMLKALKGS
jgi:hypothetical protein